VSVFCFVSCSQSGMREETLPLQTCRTALEQFSRIESSTFRKVIMSFVGGGNFYIGFHVSSYIYNTHNEEYS
jgi:hypothetical protein